MMEKQKLRKADIFSGGVIMLFGLWVVSQALQMPMQDSYGGVQNVWYVSPALFPLFVGAMIALMGAMLMRHALKIAGRRGLADTLAWLGSASLLRYLGTPPLFRFYAMIVLFFSLVFLNIPRIDFFLGAVLFLIAFITMFYFDDDVLLRRLLGVYLTGTLLTAVFFASGAAGSVAGAPPHAGDWLTTGFIALYGIYAWTLVRRIPALRRKYRTALLLSVAAPFTIGPIFKYFLLVPMPTEGLVVALLDAVRYWDF